MQYVHLPGILCRPRMLILWIRACNDRICGIQETLRIAFMQSIVYLPQLCFRPRKLPERQRESRLRADHLPCSACEDAAGLRAAFARIEPNIHRFGIHISHDRNAICIALRGYISAVRRFDSQSPMESDEQTASSRSREHSKSDSDDCNSEKSWVSEAE